MRTLILGKDGMLGRSLVAALPEDRLAGAFGREVDIADKAALARIVAQTEPELVINTAAYNQVDRAEQERDAAYATNAIGPKNLAELSLTHGFRLIHYSTNFVFDGSAGRPYAETDPMHPLSHYGNTKAQGDRFVLEENPRNLVIRTAWIFHEQGKNFLHWAYEHRNDPELRIVSDQAGNPTYSRDLAAFTLWAADRALSGLVNFTNDGICSKHVQVCEMVRLSGGTARVREAASSDFESLAVRPAEAALDLHLARDVYGYPIPSWQDAVARFVEACQTVEQQE